LHRPLHPQGFSSAELRFRLPPIDFATTCYRPHFVANNSGEYLGVEFIRGEVSAPQQDALVVVKPLFEVDYSPLLRCGAVFAIMEGGKCVGMGRVEAVRFQAAV
jgi:hypothetical protein